MEPRRHGAEKLLVYQSLLFNILPALHTKVDIYTRVFFRHHSRFIQLQIQNTTLGQRLQAVFDVMVKYAFSSEYGGIRYYLANFV